MRRVWVLWGLAIVPVTVTLGCDVILGLERAELWQLDGGSTTSSTGGTTGSTGTSGSTQSGTGGGGGAPPAVLLSHFPNVEVQGVAADPVSGAVYITGTFSEQAVLGASSFTSAGGRDAVLAALDSSGAVVWAKQIGGPKDDDGLNLAHAGKFVTFVGETRGGLSVEGHAVPDAAIPNTASFFAARYGADGALSWLSPCSGQGFADVATGPSADDPVLAGSFSSYACGAQTYFPSQDRDIFVTRLAAANGAEAKTETFHGGQFNYARAAATDGFHSIFFAGWVDTSVLIGPFQLSDGSMYVAKIRADGLVPWATTAGKGVFSAVGADKAGDVFAYGTCKDPSGAFGDPKAPAPGDGPVCVAKVSGNDGSILWARRFGNADTPAGPQFASGTAFTSRTLVVTSTGDIAISGVTQGPLSFDGHAVTGAPGYVTLLDGKTGNARWVQSLDFLTAAVAAGPAGAVVIAGTFSGTIELGGKSVTATGPADGFVAVLSP